MFSSFPLHQGKIQMSLHLGPLSLPELIHSPAVKAVLSLGEAWPLTRSSELQLGLASLEAMWSPKLAPWLSPESARITSASSDGQKQISLVFLFQICAFCCLWILLSVSETHLQSLPHFQVGVLSRFRRMQSSFPSTFQVPNQYLVGLQF